MENCKISTGKLVLTGLATAVTCILGPLSLVLPFSPVPVSLGLLAIMLVTFLLGGHLGLLSCLVYLLLGSVGLPVFSGFTGGVGILWGPTGGYLCGYLFIPLCALLLHRRTTQAPKHILPGLILGLLLCYLCGTFWLSYQMKLTFPNALLIGVLPYVPADIIKLIIAYSLSNALRVRLRKAGLI